MFGLFPKRFRCRQTFKAKKMSDKNRKHFRRLFGTLDFFATHTHRFHHLSGPKKVRQIRMHLVKIVHHFHRHVKILIIISLCGVLLVIAFWTLVLKLFPHFIHSLKVLSPNSAGMKHFLQSNHWLIRVYLFEVTNSDRLSAEIDSKIRLIERGPFTFDLRLRRLVQKSHDDTLEYRLRRQFFFRPQDSSGGQTAYDTNITYPNVPFLSFQSLLDTWLAGPKHDIARPLMDQVAEQFAPSLFVRRTPRELIHEGYHDDLIEYIERWLQFRRDLTLWGRPLFKAKFAALLFRNWTGSQEFDEMESSFPFTINTGQTDPNRAWDIVGWNGRKANTCWTDACAQVGGQEGGVFPSPINRRQTIRVFSHDLYRTVFLNFQKEVIVKGIPAYRFVVNSNTMQSELHNPDNKCFCSFNRSVASELKYCQQGSSHSLFHCKSGHVMLSTPHFLYDTDALVDQVDGLDPRPEAHETLLDIEPTTGFTVRASKRLQINILIRNESQATRNLAPTIVPLLWVEESTEMKEPEAKKLKMLIFVRYSMYTVLNIFTIIVGLMSLFTILVVFSGCYGRKKVKNALTT